MQSVSSRIWTRIAVFISYGDNDYTTGTSTTPRAPPQGDSLVESYPSAEMQSVYSTALADRAKRKVRIISLLNGWIAIDSILTVDLM